MTLRIIPQGRYGMDSQIDFLAGFTPAGYTRPTGHDHLHQFFVVEETWQPVAACARIENQAVLITTKGPGAGKEAEEQMVRILSLDVDATGFDSVCADDPVLAAVRKGHPLLRPVLFGSVYQSMAWAILSQRVRMTQAAVAMVRIADALGEPVEICGEEQQVFPTPGALGQVDAMKGVTETKAERLRSLADAVAQLDLTAHSLRKTDDSLQRLQTIDGIGPFSAELALVRGAGQPDLFPANEKRLHTAIRTRYDQPDATVAQLAEIAQNWKPWRSWAALLLRTAAAERR